MQQIRDQDLTQYSLTLEIHALNHQGLIVIKYIAIALGLKFDPNLLVEYIIISVLLKLNTHTHTH